VVLTAVLSPVLLTRVTAGNYFVQVGELDACVDFGRRESPVAKQLLDLADVGVAFQ
jgi:hypothetical protein